MTLLQIPGLDFTDQNTLDELLNQLEARRPRNVVRSQYYDARYVLRDLNISIPPKFRTFDAVLGWPAKAVDGLSVRCNLEGFTVADQTVQDLGIDAMWEDNNMDIEAPMAHDSALIHSCAFICTIQGDTQAGEPEVLIMAKDALNATGLWDRTGRELRSALSIVERDNDTCSPLQLIMYLPDRVLTITRDTVGGPWTVDERVHGLGRVPVEPLVYRPRLARQFGSSRISRPVMSWTDAALRTVVRSEIGAEFYTAPQRWALNLPAEAFEGGGWNAILGRVLVVEPPAEGDVDPAFTPQVGQFPQMTMQPHSDQLRMWATMFASETCLPLNSLGIVQDNPASAEALYASKEDLVMLAEKTCRGFGVGWRRAIRTALMLRDGRSETPEEFMRIRAKWGDPATPSQAAAADAMAKQIQLLPWIGESDVALERLGYDRSEIERLRVDRRRATAQSVVNALRVPLTPPAEAMNANTG